MKKIILLISILCITVSATSQAYENCECNKPFWTDSIFIKDTIFSINNYSIKQKASNGFDTQDLPVFTLLRIPSTINGKVIQSVEFHLLPYSIRETVCVPKTLKKIRFACMRPGVPLNLPSSLWYINIMSSSKGLTKLPVKKKENHEFLGWYKCNLSEEWSEKVEYGFMDGSNSQHSSQIHGTDDDQIYRTEHWGIVEYKIRVPNGTYKVTLMMAENYFDVAGSRIFDINVAGEYIARDLDIFQEVGKSTAYNISAENVLVTDRILNIHFGALKDNALLNGLIIESISTGIFRKSNSLLNKFYLKQNFPNPANPKTTILYQLPIEADVVLSIHNIIGQEIKILLNEKQSAGIYNIDWDASNVASGIYFYKIDARLNNKKYTRIKKMLFIK